MSVQLNNERETIWGCGKYKVMLGSGHINKGKRNQKKYERLNNGYSELILLYCPCDVQYVKYVLG